MGLSLLRFQPHGRQLAMICMTFKSNPAFINVPEGIPPSPPTDGSMPATSLWVMKSCVTCGSTFISRPCQKRRFCSVPCARNEPQTLARASEVMRRTKPGQYRKTNGMTQPETRAKVSKRLREIGHKPPIQGGNGRPVTTPQQALFEALQQVCSGWEVERRFPWGKSAIPAWLVDIAHPEMQIAIEVD